MVLSFAPFSGVARAQGISDDLKPLRFQLKKISSDKPVPPVDARTARPPVPGAKPGGGIQAKVPVPGVRAARPAAQDAPQETMKEADQQTLPQQQQAPQGAIPRAMRKPAQVARPAQPEQRQEETARRQQDGAQQQDEQQQDDEEMQARSSAAPVDVPEINEQGQPVLSPAPPTETTPSGSVTVAGAPVPIRKPGLPMSADIADAPLPRDDQAPTPPPGEEIDQPRQVAPEARQSPHEPENGEQADENDDRFSSDNRTAGQNRIKRKRGTMDSVLNSGDLPAEARNMDVAPIQEQKGESPIQIPTTSHDHGLGRDQPEDASLPPEVIVFFTEGSANLEVGQMDILNQDVVARLQEDSRLGLEIVGYSENQGSIADSAKRMSLSRALMLREYLIDKKIKADRLTLKGLGSQTDIEPRDRAELYFNRL